MITNDLMNRLSSHPAAREQEYCDLVETVRQGRCKQYHSEGFLSLESFYAARAWAVPSYDITGLFRTIADKRYPEFNDAGLDYVRSPEFVMPHESFALVMRDGKSTVVSFVAQNFLSLTGGMAECDDPRLNNSQYVADVWQYYRNAGCWARRENFLGPTFIAGDGAVSLNRSMDYNDPDFRGDQVVVAKIVGFLYMLGLRNAGEVIRLGPLPESARLNLVNRGRAGAKTESGRAVIPVTQKVLYLSTRPLNEVVLSRHVAAIGRGTPKSPHERVGHQRRLKGRSEPIMVRPCMVRGGSKGIPETTQVRLKGEE